MKYTLDDKFTAYTKEDFIICGIANFVAGNFVDRECADFPVLEERLIEQEKAAIQAISLALSTSMLIGNPYKEQFIKNICGAMGVQPKKKRIYKKKNKSGSDIIQYLKDMGAR